MPRIQKNPSARKQYGNWDWMRGRHVGDDVFIVASGPSLTGFDFKRLANRPTVVISHALHFCRADYVVFLDGSVKTRLGVNFNDPDLPYYVITGRNANLAPIGKIAVIKYAKEPQMDPAFGFYGGYSTGYIALNLGLAMGAKRCILLGFDCCGNAGKDNFYNTKEVKGYARGDGSGTRYERMIGGFAKFAPYADRIVNCSAISKIPTFKKWNIDDYLQ